MCLLRYFQRNHLMHTKPSHVHWNEHVRWERTEFHFECYMIAEIQTCKYVWLRWHDMENLLKTEEIAKSILKVKMNIESYRDNRLVNLSANVEDVTKTCGLISHASILLVSCFTRHFESILNITWAKRQINRTTKKLLNLSNNPYTLSVSPYIYPHRPLLLINMRNANEHVKVSKFVAGSSLLHHCTCCVTHLLC